MISFEEFIMGGDLPIYLQIIQYIKRGIVSGAIQDGEPVPSRRVLSSLLGVNPNTIQKAYHMLEEEGLLQSQSGAKSLVTITVETVKELRKELVESDVKSMISAMKSMGIEKQDAARLFDDLWEELG